MRYKVLTYDADEHVELCAKLAEMHEEDWVVIGFSASPRTYTDEHREIRTEVEHHVLLQRMSEP